MDVIQAVGAATEIISSLVGAVGALEQASRNMDEAPKRIRSLEEFVCDLEKLTQQIKQKHVYKLHNPKLDHKIQSLITLIDRLHPSIRKARRVVSKNKVKNLAKVVWTSMTGDPLLKIVSSIKDDINWWIESQILTEHVEKVIDSTARNIQGRLKINMEQGYPISSKCSFVKSLLDHENSQKVILIVGLSGIGKSCLARQVASDPPPQFEDGAVELGFGQWCSKAACNGCKDEYQKRLARKMGKFLVQIGYWKKIRDENIGDLEYVSCLFQEALYGKSILILLDDVWEQDIVERFAKLYDNNCRYLVTTRNESVYEITEAEKIELNKDDVKEISKAILLYHSLLREDELPGVAESLLERCGHHPLTVAVMGKALRKEIRAEKWDKAIINLSTYATFSPGPISYVNEKEAEDTVTIFGSFEFSLEAMPEDSRRLFIALAALSWAEPIPEDCLEAVWSVLGEECLFPLMVCKLVEGSLLMKTDAYSLYRVHDMVALYLDSKINVSVEILLADSTNDGTASVSPWLFIFGKETTKEVAGQKIEFFLGGLNENQAVITLEAIIQTFMSSISISELEACRASFSGILGPRVATLISTESKDLIAVLANAIENIFSNSDYRIYVPSLETVGAVDKLTSVLENCEDPMIVTNISTVLAKIAEFGSDDSLDKVLMCIPMNQLAVLLSPDAEEWHESVFSTLMSLMNAGRSNTVDKMVSSEVDKSLIKLLEHGSEVAQHHAIVTLKAFYELGNIPGNFKLLPWQARLALEKFVSVDRNITMSPKHQTFEDLIAKLHENDNSRVLEAMQDLMPIIEKAGDEQIRDMILRSPIINQLSELLRYGNTDQNLVRSESAFMLMKLACSGGEPCIENFLEYNIVPDLIKMMQCNVIELQDSAYTALHQMLFAKGGVLVLNQILQLGLVERVVYAMESKSMKTKEISMNCVIDIVELGNKPFLEQIFSLQVVEKIVKVENAGGGKGGHLVRFLRGLDKCKNLTMAERRVMKQQVIRKVAAALKGHKSEARILATVDAHVSEGSRGGGSGSGSSRYKR